MGNFSYRLITEFHARPKQPPIAPIEGTKWNVTIKNYPMQTEPPEWENFSDISSASGMTLTPKLERASLSLPPQPQIDDNKLPLNAPELVSNIGPRTTRRMVTSDTYRDNLHAADESQETFLSTFNVPLENPEVPNWNVLIRVLQPTEQEEEGTEPEGDFGARGDVKVLPQVQ